MSRGTPPTDLPDGWCCYLLFCADRKYYCGITTQLETRLRDHRCGRGGKYTRGRKPVALVWYESHTNRTSAAAREQQLKRWSHTKKKALAEGAQEFDGLGVRVWVSLD